MFTPPPEDFDVEEAVLAALQVAKRPVVNQLPCDCSSL